MHEVEPAGQISHVTTTSVRNDLEAEICIHVRRQCTEKRMEIAEPLVTKRE